MENNTLTATDSEHEYKAFVEFVNSFIIGARMCDDDDNARRAQRALRAFNADPEMDIFSEEFKQHEMLYTEEDN